MVEQPKAPAGNPNWVAHSERLDQCEEGNSAGGHAGEVEAIPHPAVSPSMTTQHVRLMTVDRWPLKYEFEPMDLANMRQTLDVMCHGCRHEVVINVDQYPGDLLVREFGPRMVCTKCGMVGADVRPNWKERQVYRGSN
jgi:hypothetical protein